MKLCLIINIRNILLWDICVVYQDVNLIIRRTSQNVRLQMKQPTSGGAVTSETNRYVNYVETANNGGPNYSFFYKPAMQTRWMAGAAPHKSGYVETNSGSTTSHKRV